MSRPWLVLAAMATVLSGCRGEPPEILSFTAAPSRLQAGQPSTLTWSVKSATRVTLKDPAGVVEDGLELTGGLRVVYPAETGTYELTAYRNEVTRSAMVLVTVGGGPRILNFDASPAVVAPGVKSTLSWATDGAGSVAISDGASNLPIEAIRTSGQFEVYPAATTTYTLTAQGSAGLISTQAVTVEVPVPPQILSFSASPTSVNPNQPVTLAWSVSATSEVTIKKSSSGGALALGAKAQLAQGSYDVRPDRSETYTLTASGAGGTATAQAQVGVLPVITTFESSPPGADPAEPYTLRWSTHSAVRLRLLKNQATVLLDTTDLATADSGTFPEPAPGTVTDNSYEVEITSREGMKISKFVTVSVGPKPQITDFKVAPAAVTTGKRFTVAWKTSGSASIVIKLNGATATTLTSAPRLADGSWDSPAQATAGPVTVELIARSTVLSQETRFATVEVHPPVSIGSFTATPATVANAGDPVTLAWTVAGASSAELRAGAAAISAAGTPSASLVVKPLTSGPYALRAFNPAGDWVEKTVNLIVQTPSTELGVAPSPFVPGEEVAVSWSITAAGAAFARLAPAPYLVRTDVLADLSTTGTALALSAGDEAVATLTFPTGFSFDLGQGRAPATSAVVSTNGFLTLAPEWTDPAPANLAAGDAAAPPLLIAPLWDDLLLPSAEVRWQLVDADTLAVQWTAAQFRTGAAAAGSATFQAVLSRDGTVDFLYGTLTSPAGEPTRAQGSSATVAMSGARQSWTSEFTVNAARLSGVASVRFQSGPVALSGEGKLRPSHTVEVSLHALDTTSTPLVWQARASALAAGDVVVSEVLPLPAIGVDPQLGEWLELRNASAAAVDLSNVVLSAGSGSFTMPAGTGLPPGGTLVLGNSANPSLNGNVPVAIAWGSALDLPDSSGTAALSLRSLPLGQLAWGGATAPPAGSSIRLDQVAVLGPGAPASAALCLDATPSPGASNGGCHYDVTTSASPVIDITGTGQDLTPAGNTSGDWRVQLDFTALSGTAPAFSFPLFGTTFAKADVSSNGWLSLFNSATTPNSSSASTPKPLPTAGNPNAIIAPFWDDLSTSKSGSSSPPAKLFVLLQDPDNNPATADRILIIEWSHFDLPSTTQDADLTFEVLLHESTGEVELRWGALTPGEAGDRALGSTASVGLEDPTGQIGLPLPTPLAPSTGVRFTRPP